jgi:hypothetical protein
MTSALAIAVLLLVGAGPVAGAKVTCTFPVSPKIEEQKFPFVSDQLGGVELDLIRQTAATDDGTFLLVSVQLGPLLQSAGVKAAKPEDQEALLTGAFVEIQKQVSERLVRSVSGKIVDRKPIQFGAGRAARDGTALSGPTLDEGGQPSGAFIAYVVATEAPALHVALAATRNDKLSQAKANEFVKSLTLPPAAGKR